MMTYITRFGMLRRDFYIQLKLEALTYSDISQHHQNGYSSSKMT